MVDRHALQLMMQEIELIKKQKKMQTEKEEISSHMTMFKSYERYVNEIKEKGSAADIYRTFPDMKNEAE